MSRLEKLAEGKSIREISEGTDISQTGIRSYLKNGVIPSADKAFRLAEFFDVDFEWLVTGTKSARTVPVEAGGEASPTALLIPYYRDAYASAGFGNHVNQNSGELVLVAAEVLPYRSKKLTIINVAGDSMVPTLMPDERVVVDTSINNYVMSGIYVLRWDGCLYIKRLEKEPRGPLHIKSDNPHAFSWEYIPNEDSQEDFAILGRVIMKFQNI